VRVRIYPAIYVSAAFDALFSGARRVKLGRARRPRARSSPKKATGRHDNQASGLEVGRNGGAGSHPCGRKGFVQLRSGPDQFTPLCGIFASRPSLAHRKGQVRFSIGIAAARARSPITFTSPMPKPSALHLRERAPEGEGLGRQRNEMGGRSRHEKKPIL
jgi:hypothetical protein